MSTGDQQVGQGGWGGRRTAPRWRKAAGAALFWTVAAVGAFAWWEISQLPVTAALTGACLSNACWSMGLLARD